MYYYQFNIGDYVKSTRHLSLLEDIAYRRLLDLSYDTEKPLGSDVDKIARLIGMRDHKKETQQILDEFFKLTKNGYIQKRVQKELDAYSAKADASRKNGKLGGRPRKTQQVNLANLELTQPKAKQEPLTNNQEPLKNKDLSENLKVCIPNDFVLNDTNKNWINKTNMPDEMKLEIFEDFVDYWRIDGSKKTLNGWQMAFRKNPIIKRKITNYLHSQGKSNEENKQSTRKLSAAERASKQVRDFEAHIRQKQADNS